MSKEIIGKQTIDKIVETVLAVSSSDDLDARAYCANAAKPLALEIRRLNAKIARMKARFK